MSLIPPVPVRMPPARAMASPAPNPMINAAPTSTPAARYNVRSLTSSCNVVGPARYMSSCIPPIPEPGLACG